MARDRPLPSCAPFWRLAAKGYNVILLHTCSRFGSAYVCPRAPPPTPSLGRLASHCRNINAGEPITFFEATTALAFLAFAQDAGQADVLLLETGLGGRLDATNVVEKPCLCLLTPISYDHQQFLGTSLPSIACEKAGIFRKDVSVVVSSQPRSVQEVLEREASKTGAPLLCEGRAWDFVSQHARELHFFWKGQSRGVFGGLSLQGVHQLRNAALSLAAVSALAEQNSTFAVSGRACDLGLRAASWPARLQRLRGGLLRLLPAEQAWQVWVDGGHNQAAAQALAASIRARKWPFVHLIWGMKEEKSAFDFLAPFEGLVGEICTLSIPFVRSHPSHALSDVAQSLGLAVKPVENLAEAFHWLETVGTPAPVFICGSLHLAAEALRCDGCKTNL